VTRCYDTKLDPSVSGERQKVEPTHSGVPLIAPNKERLKIICHHSVVVLGEALMLQFYSTYLVALVLLSFVMIVRPGCLCNSLIGTNLKDSSGLVLLPGLPFVFLVEP